MEEYKSDARKEMGPKLVLKWSSHAMPFYSYYHLPMIGRIILAIACDLHKDGINIYRVWSNADIANMWRISESYWKVVKARLRDLKLIDYEGNIGDLSEIIEIWQNITKEEWKWPLK